MSDTFPPSGPTTLTQILKAYVYAQFSDDDNIQAFNASFNGTAQQYLDWFNTINLPIYTGLSGPLLDWVAQGLYGISRPSLQYGTIAGRGLLNTYMLNTMMLNSFVTTGSVQSFVVNDDFFKRIITWFFFKGDGMNYSVLWLKRRVMRFITAANGAAPNIDQTYPVSVAYGSGDDVIITVTLTGTTIDPLAAQIFQAAIASSVLCVPFQYSFSVVIA